MGKKVEIVVGVIGVLLLALIVGWLIGVMVGGYAIWGVGRGKPIVVENPALLTEMVGKIRQAGGVMGTIILVERGVDSRAEYVGYLPSKDKPIVALSGCRKPMTLLGLVSWMRVEVDTERVEQVWGAEEAKRRINGLMVQCLIYGMSRSEPSVFDQAVTNVMETMAGQRVFGIPQAEAEK